MSINITRLRGNKPRVEQKWCLGAFSKEVIVNIGKQLAHRMAVGYNDISGDDFGNIFATAINGIHKSRPLGLADVIWNNSAWSTKIIKHSKPFKQSAIRLIVGRNSPTYSSGINNCYTDVIATGKAILDIWNERVNEALNEYDDLKMVILIRNFDTREFVLFEDELRRYAPNDFEWRVNENKNLEGFNKRTNEHTFTWQPHGSQLTVKRHVPGSAVQFKIDKIPSVIAPDNILEIIGFNENWIKIINL